MHSLQLRIIGSVFNHVPFFSTTTTTTTTTTTITTDEAVHLFRLQVLILFLLLIFCLTSLALSVYVDTVTSRFCFQALFPNALGYSFNRF